MARPRNRSNRDLPEGLYYDQKKGYRLRLVNGSRANVGHDKRKAIAIALQYNEAMRLSAATTVERLIATSSPSIVEVGTSTTFSAFLEKIKARFLEDKQYAEDAKATFENDYKRFSEYFADVTMSNVDIRTVNGYIEHYHAGCSNNVYNRKLSFLQNVFSYACDEGLMTENPAVLKKRKVKEKKKRRRLSLESYKKILQAAPPFLRTAMALSLQTTHARLEVSRIEYRIKKPESGRCGCVWFPEPKVVDGKSVFGTLYIHRQKTDEKEASHVAIPIGAEIKRIIDESRDGVLSKYVVHRIPKNQANGISKECDDITQLTPDYISREFSKVRDKLALYNNLEMDERPSFHEIRALSARLYSDQGDDPQARMAHSDAKTTKIYVENHREWTHVPHAQLNI